MKRPIVALLTDYGTIDTYVSEVKAVILRHRPDTVIVDITHEVEPFNTLEGAFMLLLAAKSFPPNTIFLAVVDPGVGGERDAVIVKTKRGRFFIGPDTGLLYPAVEADGISKVYSIKVETLKNVSKTFHGRDVFAQLAGLIAAGKKWHKHVREKKTLTRLDIPKPKFFEDAVEATVMHVDRFGNIILNIPGALPEDWKNVNIAVRDKVLKNVKTCSYYSETAAGDFLLLVGGTGYLELAVNKGNASQILSVKAGDKMHIIKSHL